MKNLFKGVLIVGMTMMGLMLSGCGTKKPEDVVKAELDSLKEASAATDGEELKELLGEQDLSSWGDDEELLIKLLKGYDYEIIESREDGDTAEVDAKITTLDTKTLVKDCKLTLSRQWIAADTSDTFEDDEAAVFAVMSELLDNPYDVVTNTVTFSMKKVDGRWDFADEDVAIDSMLGYLITYSEDPYLVRAEDIAKLFMDYLTSLDGAGLRELFGIDHFFTDDDAYAEQMDSLYAEQLADSLNYEILSSDEEKGNLTASVTLSITSCDLTKLFAKFLERLEESDASTQEEFMSEYNELLLTTLQEGMEPITMETELPFENDGETWLPSIDSDSFANAILGNYDEALKLLEDTAKEQ